VKPQFSSVLSTAVTDGRTEIYQSAFVD